MNSEAHPLLPVLSRLRFLVRRLDRNSGIPLHVEDLDDLFSTLLHGADLIRQSGGPESAAIACDIQEYRGLLERLRRVLPIVQAELLADRARLEARRSHVEAAAAWTDASRKTLP